jgi:hypothetical protein
MLLVWLLIRWQRVRDDRLLVVLGAVIGIAAMTKFQVMLLCLVLLVAVAIRGPRELLRRPLFWAGAVLAALIAAPTLIWQHLHGWPQLRMTPVVAGEAEALYGGRPGISVQLLVFAGLAGLVLGSYGLFRLLRADEMRPYRYLGMTFGVLYVVFVATAGRPYYLAGLYAPLVASGALGLQRRREAGRAPRRWLVWPAWLTATAVAVGLLVTSVSIARSDVAENIARRTADVYHGLPPRSGTEPSSSASPTSRPRSSTVTRSATPCRRRTAPTAATGTSRRRRPTTTSCSTSEMTPVHCTGTSPMPTRSPTSTMTCTRIC